MPRDDDGVGADVLDLPAADSKSRRKDGALQNGSFDDGFVGVAGRGELLNAELRLADFRQELLHVEHSRNLADDLDSLEGTVLKLRYLFF